MTFEVIGPDDHDKLDKMKSMMLPHSDHMMGSVVSAIWMSLPDDRRSADEVERQLMRLAHRAIQNLREDIAAFGAPGGATSGQPKSN